MDDWLFYLALVSLLVVVASTIEVVLGILKIPHLKKEPLYEGPHPNVSIIIPACNEAETIKPALTSILALDDDCLEIIVINDRSTDQTGAILEKMGHQYPQLKILTLSTLPKGWLGKNNAMFRGADIATGDYLLFTDADIHIEKTAIQRALHHMKQRQLDHVTLFFGLKIKSQLLNMMILESVYALFAILKPWKVTSSSTKQYIGIGAFNLIKKTAYEKIGGHQPISLQPLDDLMLGKLVKVSGLKQGCLFSDGLVSVEWYPTLKALIQGFTKNSFAFFDYSLVKVILTLMITFILSIFPVWALFFTTGATFWLNIFVLLIRFANFFFLTRLSEIPGSGLFWLFLTPYIIVFTHVRATILTLWHQGIFWRNTFYPLAMLKKQRL